MTTWTFHIRPGVKFHDGSDWNAAAAEINFLSLIDENYEHFNSVGAANVGFTLSHVQSVRALDEFTFEMKLNKPFYGFVDKLASYPCCAIVSGKAIQSMTAEEISQGVVAGTGHFKFVEWKRGEKVTMERNEDYWGENALLDEIVFVPILDQASRVAALLAGEVDVAAELTPDNLILVRGIEGFNGYSRGLSTVYSLQPNHREPPFDDHRVRRAVSLCFDREILANDIMKGIFDPGAQIWGKGHEGFDPDGPQITDNYNPELAKQLLAEAGYPDGFRTKMYGTTSGLGVPELQTNNYVVISLRECGIEVELVSLEWMTYLGYWSGGISEEENIGLFTMNMGTGDLAGFDQYIHSASWPPAGWSVG